MKQLGQTQSREHTDRYHRGAQRGKESQAAVCCFLEGRTRIFQPQPISSGGLGHSLDGRLRRRPRGRPRPPPPGPPQVRLGQAGIGREEQGCQRGGDAWRRDHCHLNDTASTRPPPAEPRHAVRPEGAAQTRVGRDPRSAPQRPELGPRRAPAPRPPPDYKFREAPSAERGSGDTNSSGTPDRAARGERPAHARSGHRTTAPSAPRHGGAHRGARWAL